MTTYVEIDGYQVPVIENIHQKVYAAASKPGALNMAEWHTCKSTHCRAGWVTKLAGKAGARLESDAGTISEAAWLIYQASDPSMIEIPSFSGSNEEALADMREFAEREAARQQATT